MPINDIRARAEMTSDLDKKFEQKAQSAMFEDNGLGAKFIGNKTVYIPKMNMSGLGDYDRDTGFASGAVSVTQKPYELKQDRGTSFQIDSQVADESGIGDIAGKTMGEFVRLKVVPEVDAYVMSKLAGLAVEKEHTITGTLSADVFKMINEATAKAQNAVGYDEELVCFVDSTALAALRNTPEISRYLVMNDFKKGDLHTQVVSLNGVSILPMQDSRMKTAYTFLTGDGGPDDFGFTPTETAKKIGILLMPRRGASLIKKTETIRVFTPSENQTADAWKIDYRIYYDVVVKDSMMDGIYVHTY